MLLFQDLAGSVLGAIYLVTGEAPAEHDDLVAHICKQSRNTALRQLTQEDI